MRLGELGVLDQSRTELVHGEIWNMPPQGNAHSVAISNLYDELRRLFPKPWFIRCQATHRFAQRVAYEPDLALLTKPPVSGALIDETPSLIVEVSESTLAYDLGDKRLDYARFGVPEYWVVDLPSKTLHVFRSPNINAVDAASAYAVTATYAANDEVSPGIAPTQLVQLSDVWPL